MKKIFLCFSLIILLITGCGENKSDKENDILNNEKNQQKEEVMNVQEQDVPKLKEGKYIQIAPSNENAQNEGYDFYLTLENGKATEYDTYFEATTEGTYSIDGNKITIHFTRNYGTATYGEPYDEIIDRTIYAHFDNNQIIYDSYSDFPYYETGTIIFELK